MNNTQAHIKSIVSNLPETPGVYQYLDESGTVIYVGKAKNLKRRVSSYFNKTQTSPKVNALVKKISDLKYIVVNSETDALLLENNLIKKYQPKYNILLKDGKTYPWLCITKEPYPRVFKTRNRLKMGEYYGPYSTVWVLDLLLDLIHRHYPLRTCRIPLLKENVYKGKYKICLQYHIKKCAGCCEAKQSWEAYQKMIEEIREIVKGDSEKISQLLLDEMEGLSKELRFEEAAEIKTKYDALNEFQQKTVVTTTRNCNYEVFNYNQENDIAFVNWLRIIKGSIVQGFTIECHQKLDETKEELLAAAIQELLSRFPSKGGEFLVPFLPDLELENVSFTIPQKGDKKKLLDLSMQNVKQYQFDRLKQQEKLNPQQRYTKILKLLQEALQLKSLPLHIECFDNSNLQGSDPVAACVVFKQAKPSKKDYRKYNIKTVEGPDDYASMREVVQRRYRRLIDEQQSLPDLIIADGGIGQMHAMHDAIASLGIEIPIAGLAKNDKHQTRELLYGFPPQAIGLNPQHPLFQFLTNIQNEVHRFAISFHRNKRSKSQIHSELENINGLGPKGRQQLFDSLKTVSRIRTATKLELEKIIGTSRASIVYNYFHPTETL